MAVCCVKSCKNNQLVTQTPEKKHFFRFPVNEARKRRWMEILRVENAGPNSRICMLHFRDDEIDYTSPFRALLSKMAVPSLEPLPRLRRSMPQPIMPQPIMSKNHPANYKIDNSQLLQILQSPNMQLEQNGQPLQIKLVPQTGGQAAPPPTQPNNFGMHFMANSQSNNVQQPLQIKFVPQTSSPNGPMAVKLVPQQNSQQSPLVQFLPQQQNQNQMAIKFVPQMQQQQSSNQPLAVKFVPQQNGPQGQQMQIKFVPQQNGQIRPMGVIMPPGAKQNGDMSFKFIPQSNGGQFGGNKNNASKQKNKILEEYQHVLEQNGVTVSSNNSKEDNLPQLTPFRQGGGGQRSENNFPQIQTVHSLADDDENDRRQRKILSGDAREMVWNVYKYFKMNGNPKAIQATSEACCVPIRTLNRILQVARSAHLNMQAFQRQQQPPPPPPPMMHNRPQNLPSFIQNSRDAPFKLGSAALNRIRHVITNYKCPDVGYPTIFDLFDEVQKFMYFPGEIKTFRNVLRAMGYRWKKRGEHIVLYEQIGEKHWRNVFGFQRRNRMQRKPTPQPEPEERNTSTPIIPEPTVIIKEEPSEIIEPQDHEMEPMDTKAQEEAEDSFDSEYEYQESDKYRGERGNRFKQEPSDSAEGEGPDDSYKGDLSEFYTVEQGEYEGDGHEQEEGDGDYGDSQDQGEYDQENSGYYGEEQNEGGEDGWRDEGEVSEFMEDQSYY